MAERRGRRTGGQGRLRRWPPVGTGPSAGPPAGNGARPRPPSSGDGPRDAADGAAAVGTALHRSPAGRRRLSGGRARPAILAAIATGGGLGAPARYLIGRAVHAGAGAFPWATFWINLSGSFALGLLLTLVLERWPPTRFVRPFAAVGFLGAYTTFSTFGVEADLLVSAGHLALGAAYVAGSLAGGLAAVYLGVSLGRLWPGSGET